MGLVDRVCREIRQLRSNGFSWESLLRVSPRTRPHSQRNESFREYSCNGIGIPHFERSTIPILPHRHACRMLTPSSEAKQQWLRLSSLLLFLYFAWLYSVCLVLVTANSWVVTSAKLTTPHLSMCQTWRDCLCCEDCYCCRCCCSMCQVREREETQRVRMCDLNSSIVWLFEMHMLVIMLNSLISASSFLLRLQRNRWIIMESFQMLLITILAL